MADDLSQALALLRAQRHSFMNHLQVISGWLQMGKTDRAAQYISQVAGRMESEGNVLRHAQSPAVALFVLSSAMEAEPFGVTIDWRVNGPVDIGALAAAQATISRELERAAGQPEGARRVIVTLGRTISVHRPTVQSEG